MASKKAKSPARKLNSRVLTTFIENVRRRRAALGLSQVQASIKAGLEHNYVCHFENGRRPAPSLDTLTQLAKALETTEAKLLTKGGWRED
jgi:transcriptional regulator with XRE-family HTH domain